MFSLRKLLIRKKFLIKINNCIIEIKNNNFDIKPIILNQTNKSCPNCKYASICFHTEKDNVYIDTKGDDENAELD